MKVLGKMYEYVSSCPDCCDCWSRDKYKVQPQKIQITHTHMEQPKPLIEQPRSGRLDSTSSATDSIRSYR